MNQETVALIESSQGWRELANAAASGKTPQSVGVVIPHIMQETFSEMYGRLVLGNDLWRRRASDMINAGTILAPSIDGAASFRGLALHPLSSGAVSPSSGWRTNYPSRLQQPAEDHRRTSEWQHTVYVGGRQSHPDDQSRIGRYIVCPRKY
ncbi:MAG: hypothetical protein ACLUEQ_07805 [Cloacibacillus evryensis]